MLGLGSTFDFDSRLLPLEWDRVVTAGLAGPMLEYADRHGGLITRATLTAQYGFSMVTSLAYPGAAAAFADSTIKSELKQQGYYYAQSVTGAATLSLNDEPIEVYLRARVGAYWSINNGDRYQGEITDNFSLHDQRIYLRAAGLASHPRRTAARRPARSIRSTATVSSPAPPTAGSSGG